MNGDLSDISLTDLIQMVCRRQGKNVLLSLVSGDTTGTLYIDDGEVIHAEVGAVVGESAVYRLLAWQTGSFQLDHYDQPPRRSVTLPWGVLMVEGTRLLNENPAPPVQKVESSEKSNGKQASPVAEAVQPASLVTEAKRTADDAALESGFVDLFLKLEQGRTLIGEKRMQKQPDSALRCLAVLVNAIIDFSSKRPGSNLTEAALQAGLESIARDVPQIHRVRVENGFLSLQSISDLYANRKGDATTPHKFSQLVDGILDMMTVFLKQLTDRFYSPDHRTQWEEISSTFLSDLAVLVKKIHF